MNLKRMRWPLVIAVCSVFFVPGCKRPKEPVQGTALDVIKIGLSRGGELNTLNPVLANNATTITLAWHLYSRLCDLDKYGRVVPMVASRWNSSPDLITWRFEIRNDVNFYSKDIPLERMITPADVKASVEYALSKPTYGRGLLAGLVEGAAEFIGGRLKNIPGIELTRDAVIFHLKKPFAYLPERLATSFVSILPAEHLESIEKGSVVGSGPFLLESFDKTTNKVVLVSNPRYWDKRIRPLAKRIEVFWVPNEGTLVSEFRAKNLDVIELASRAVLQVPADSLETRIQTLNVALIAFNVNGKKFKDSRIRRNLERLVDQAALAAEFPGSLPLSGPFPKMIRENYGLEDERAPRITSGPSINDAGSLDLLIMPTEPFITIGQLVSKQWQLKGVKVRPILGQADFLKKVTEGTYDIALAYYGPTAPSLEQYSWPYLAAMVPLPNAAGYKNPKFEEMYDLFVGSASLALQKSLILSMEKIISEDMPYISLFQLSFRIWHPKSIDLDSFANGIISLLK